MVIGRPVEVPRYEGEEAQQRLRDWMTRTGMTQAQVAKRIGMSPGALNQWLKGTYPGDGEGIKEKVCSLLAVEAAREETSLAQDFVMTSLAAEILAVCRFAHVYRDIAVVYGDAGMGKTVALKRYRGEHRDAVYVRCDPSCRSPQATLGLLASALGRRPKWGGSLRAMIESLVGYLDGSGRLLMFDEANFLSLRSLEVLRALHDEAEVGLVLCGNHEVYTQMYGEGRAAFAQLFSRVGIRRRVTLGMPQEDVVALVRSVAGDLSEECLTYLARKAAEPGGTRRVVKILRLGLEVAACDHAIRPEVKHLRQAEAMLMGEASAVWAAKK